MRLGFPLCVSCSGDVELGGGGFQSLGGRGGLVGLRCWSSRADRSPSREEQEKLNVWVALLNLENMYGSQESLTKVFERAVQYNEPLKVFLHLADIYTKSEKFQVGVWARRPAARGSPTA